MNSAATGTVLASPVMNDLPPGEWSALLVGDQWPDPSSVEVLFAAGRRRGEVAAALEGYADTLRSVRDTHLAAQDGVTAEAARESFTRGEAAAREAADRNRVKGAAYRSAQRCVDQLRRDLTDIARQGNSRIADITGSDTPPAVKVGAIVEVITAARAAATGKVAEHADGVYSAVQSVLTAQGLTGSARTFAAAHGVDPQSHRIPVSHEAVRGDVAGRIAGTGTRP